MGFYPSPIEIIAVDTSTSRMDCEDDGSARVWVVVPGWSYRRAVLTHAAPFLKAAGTDDIFALEGMRFTARMDLYEPPPFEHEGGERIEFPELELGETMEVIHSSLGLEPPEVNTRELTFKDEDRCTQTLRRWFNELGQTEEATQIMVDVGHCWYSVTGVRYTTEHGVVFHVDKDLPVYPREVFDEEECFSGDPFVTFMSFSDAAELSDEHGADIARSEWPEGQFLRHDMPSDSLLLHQGSRDPVFWLPDQMDIRMHDWVVRKHGEIGPMSGL